MVCSPYGFVTFTSELAQRLASREQYRRDVNEFVLAMPPDPSDVLYNTLMDDDVGAAAWDWVARLSLLAVFIFWAPIVVVISSWTSLSSLQGAEPRIGLFLKDHAGMEPILTGLLSTAALKLFLAFLPMILFSIIQNFRMLKAGAQAQLDLQRCYITFLVIFVLLVTTLGQGIASTLYIIARDPSSIVEIAAYSLPSASHFYFNYILLGCFTLTFELLRISNLVKYWFYKHFCSFLPEEAKQYSEPEDQASYGMGTRSALAVLMSAITFSFCTTSPLVVVFSLIYFSIAPVTYGYLLVFAETKKPDLGGEFWIQALQQLFMILALYVILMVGVLLAKVNGNWVGPPAAAGLSLLAIYWAFLRVSSLAFESLPLEEVVRATQAKKKGENEHVGSYVQHECDPDITLEDETDAMAM